MWKEHKHILTDEPNERHTGCHHCKKYIAYNTREEHWHETDSSLHCRKLVVILIIHLWVKVDCPNFNNEPNVNCIKTIPESNITMTESNTKSWMQQALQNLVAHEHESRERSSSMVEAWKQSRLSCGRHTAFQGSIAKTKRGPRRWLQRWEVRWYLRHY